MTALEILKMLFGIVVAALIVIVCALTCALDASAQSGGAIGLLLGIVSGPTRIAAVDFRQWFRDPGQPAQAGDDSPYGLVRDVFRSALGAVSLFAAGSLFISTVSWLPATCQSPRLGVLDRIGLVAILARWNLDAFFMGCSPALAGVKFWIGLASGAAVVHLLAELAWRFGLRGVPNPVLPRRFLAPYDPGGIPRMRAVAGPRKGRRLIVCCDGTWNWPDGRRETNVIRLVRAIAPGDADIPQIIYYHQGVGTGNILDRIVGGGAGVGLSLSVKACYGFLSDNYIEGDEIFLFGFSRGAFVARSVAGMIGTVGILRKSEMERFIEVWDWYTQPKDDRRAAVLDALAPHRHTDVEIECIGVWDTVGALGIPGTRFCAQAFAFYETELGAHVRHAFQALAIDERRGNFQAAVWVPRNIERHRAMFEQGEAPEAPPPSPHARRDGPRQVLKQVWFPGVHSNVGGGYPQHGLSDTTFLWMLEQLQVLRGPHRQALLRLNPACVTPALDHSEPYPTGTLDNSRGLFWKLIGSAVPRPVCIINETEEIHESAWLRGDPNDPYPVSAADIYRGVRRTNWLAAFLARRLVRQPYEVDHAVTERLPPDPAPRLVPNNIGICGRFLQLIGGSG